MTPTVRTTMTGVLLGALLASLPRGAAAQEETEVPAGGTNEVFTSETGGPIGAPPPPSPAPAKKGVQFQFLAGVEGQLTSDLDDSGDVDRVTLFAGLRATWQLSEKLDLTLGTSYRVDDWNFDGASAFGGNDPFDDAHYFSLGANLNFRVNEDWSVFGGPIAQSARESNGDFGNSWVYGGFAGASVRTSDSFLFGLGLGVVSRLEDDARFYPVLVLRWDITNGMRLKNTGPEGVIGRTGIELEIDIAQNWQVGFGGAWEFQEFRLDDDEFARDGVGRSEGIPLWGRISWQMNPNIELTFRAGLFVAGNVEVKDSDGRKINDEDYQAALTLGFGATIQF